MSILFTTKCNLFFCMKWKKRTHIHGVEEMHWRGEQFVNLQLHLNDTVCASGRCLVADIQFNSIRLSDGFLWRMDDFVEGKTHCSWLNGFIHCLRSFYFFVSLSLTLTLYHNTETFNVQFVTYKTSLINCPCWSKKHKIKI